MKKYLLGALFVLGTMAYAQDNKVIAPVDGNGNATANLGIEVTGKVFDPADLSLVVEIKSAASASGTGFAFTMPNMFAKTANVATAQGDFEAYLTQNETRVPFASKSAEGAVALSVDLIQGGAVVVAPETTEPAGTATGVTLAYSLIGGNSEITDIKGKTGHSGGVAVTATTTTATTHGTYSDTSVQLRVALTNQLLPTTTPEAL